MGSLSVLAIGDVVGRPGRDALMSRLEGLRTRYGADLAVVNSENAAGGKAITPPVVRQFLGSGVDVVTTGNHVWGNRDILTIMGKEPRLLRPHNYPPAVPGCGFILVDIRGMKVCVINLMGRISMEQLLDCPFRAFDRIYEEKGRECDSVIVDFHAEATAEKQAFGRYVDGRASLVFGTHTHVQTADERVLPGGTGYITDVGMTGPFDSIIGMNVDDSIKRLTTQMKISMKVAQGESMVCGIRARIEEGSTVSIERFCL